ncbi:MAG TPA: serine/threonine-protein kinase, partial [Ktedonobacterales bacterium]|nr:serine/threonine-protein kinase [Ktedonobacterales bacterium]
DAFSDEPRAARRHGRREWSARHEGDTLVGKQLGPYLLKQLLAVGGMAEVYRARDLARQRVVAVKVLASHLAEDAMYASQFRDEALRAERLCHPHVTPIYDLGEDVVGERSVPYLVMPLMRRSLSQRLRREGTLPYLEALRLTLEAAAGLQAAHEAGLIHCDVKPGNILLDAEGHALLCDFGVALDITRAASSQAQGATLPAQSTTRPTSRETQEWVAGTPAYMAPEQLCGGMVDQRADIYSLGVVLYQLLTGRRPFEGETPLDIARRALRDPIAPPSSLMPDRALPLSLDSVLLSALARDPRDRFSTMSEFAMELRRVRSDPEGVWDAEAGGGEWNRWPTPDMRAPVLARREPASQRRLIWQAPLGRISAAKRLLCVAAIAASLVCATGITTMFASWGAPGGSGGRPPSMSLIAPEARTSANAPNVVITPRTPTPTTSNSGGDANQSGEAALVIPAPSPGPRGHGHGHNHGHGQSPGKGKGHWRDNAIPAHGHPAKTTHGADHGGNGGNGGNPHR